MLELTCSQRFLINILKQGHIPQHMSFIMDGNRRHALNKNKQSYKGHQQGKESLKTYLLYCLQLGIKQTSFFCFSIQNFKRSQLQINKLMELVLNTFDQLSEVSEFVLKKNVQVRIKGKIQLLRKDVYDCLVRVQEKTKNNNKMIVNLCFAYDSLDQINTAIDKATQIQQKGNNKSSSQLSFNQVYNQLMITTPIDVLVRTSNQSRLSNFMLMQNSYSLIYILKQNWPQINLISLAKILFHYNYHYKSIQKKKNKWLEQFQTNKQKQLKINETNLNANEQEKQKLL